jgi:hypothetical protein
VRTRFTTMMMVMMFCFGTAVPWLFFFSTHITFCRTSAPRHVLP